MRLTKNGSGLTEDSGRLRSAAPFNDTADADAEDATNSVVANSDAAAAAGAAGAAGAANAVDAAYAPGTADAAGDEKKKYKKCLETRQFFFNM